MLFACDDLIKVNEVDQHVAQRWDAPLRFKAADLSHMSNRLPSDGYRDLINRRRLSDCK